MLVGGRDELQAQDIIEIHQLIALYGHAIDADDQSLVPLVFASDGVFDSSAMGGPVIEGVEALTAFYAASKPHLPPSHNTTNVYVYEQDGETRVRSKWFMVNRRDNTVALGDYDDLVVRTDDGWRLRHRMVKVRHPKPA